MAYTTIDKPSDYFETLIWTGNGNTPRTLSGLDFQPDWIWGKRRDDAAGHNLIDAVRGFNANSELASSTTGVEGSNAAETYGYLSAVTSDGFTVTAGSSDNAYWNNNTATYVAWNWLGANGTASNSNGSITSSVSANTTAGFSIVSFTGTGSNATVGHGLSAVPKMIITKKRSSADNWYTYHASLGATKVVYLDLSTASETYSTNWNDTEPTSSVFSLGTAGTNSSSSTYIAYCFAEKKGYSKFGSYTGNGNADGTFIYTGFKPAFIMLKPTSTTGNWFILDNKRSSFNVMDKYIRANLSNAEATFSMMDFVSNGVKIITSDSSINGSGVSYIYMAFAENPFVTSGGIPTTAR